jgi:RimJ/RimL family protein N-acetyltransferase
MGFATELVEVVVRYAFEECHVTTLTARSAAENEASIRLLRNLGFRQTRTTIERRDGRPNKRFVHFSLRQR